MESSTIFDDVFRTMLEKMPQLAVPLINEVFGTSYPEDVKIIQKRNEHQTQNGRIITDSHLLIANRIYHIECQSTDDSTMVIRMIEYDFAISLEQVQEFTCDDMLQKHLLFLLPYHVIKYEQEKGLDTDSEKWKELLDEYAKIEKYLEKKFS